jgi:hypothetical protein
VSAPLISGTYCPDWSAVRSRVAAHDRRSGCLRLRTRQTNRRQVGGGPQMLALRGLSPREPAIPVAYALAQLGPLNTEISAAGGSALQARVLITASLLCLPEVSLRVWWSEQDGLLICAISSDDAVALLWC